MLRALGLRRCCYYSLLHFFHSDALNLEALTCLWCRGLWRLLPRHIIRVGARPVVLVDGLKYYGGVTENQTTCAPLK